MIMTVINETFFRKYYPRRSKDSYKNLNGKVFIVAGCKDMPGAAVLASRAAYAAGAGFVTVATVSDIRPALINAVPEALILDIKSSGGYLGAEALAQIKEYLKNNPQDVILTGCGLSKGALITEELLKYAALPAVIDADSLNFISSRGASVLKDIPCILTPHVGEMKRLLGGIPFDAESAALKISELSGGVCLLKGPATQICFNGSKKINSSGNEGLAKAGSGDVLAGIIAAVWAKTLKAGGMTNPRESGFLAASLGVYLHGACADYAAENASKESITASMLIEALPFVLKKLLD